MRTFLIVLTLTAGCGSQQAVDQEALFLTCNSGVLVFTRSQVGLIVSLTQEEKGQGQTISDQNDEASAICATRWGFGTPENTSCLNCNWAIINSVYGG